MGCGGDDFDGDFRKERVHKTVVISNHTMPMTQIVAWMNDLNWKIRHFIEGNGTQLDIHQPYLLADFKY